MKKLSIALFSFCLTFSFGQKVSDYKYISVPNKLSGFQKESYDVDQSFIKALKSKKYVVIKGGREDWPAEIKNESCSVLAADVIDDSNFLKNRVLIEFKDCNNKVVLATKGSSNIKDYKEGFQDALSRALPSIPVSNPITHQPTLQENTNQKENENTSSITENKAGKYTNGKLTLQKIQIDANQFILADSNSSVPYATFKITSKKDVFKVKLADGNYTIGYFENQNIVIDIPQANGDYYKEVFSGK